jgi:hypothetical protein
MIPRLMLICCFRLIRFLREQGRDFDTKKQPGILDELDAFCILRTDIVEVSRSHNEGGIAARFRFHSHIISRRTAIPAYEAANLNKSRNGIVNGQMGSS